MVGTPAAQLQERRCGAAAALLEVLLPQRSCGCCYHCLSHRWGGWEASGGAASDQTAQLWVCQRAAARRVLPLGVGMAAAMRVRARVTTGLP